MADKGNGEQELPAPGLKPLDWEREKVERKRGRHFYGVGVVIYGLFLFFMLLGVWLVFFD